MFIGLFWVIIIVSKSASSNVLGAFLFINKYIKNENATKNNNLAKFLFI